MDFVLLCLGSSCSGSKLARILLHINGLCLPANLVCNFHAHKTHANTYDEAKRNEKQPWKALNMSWFLSSVVRNLFVQRLRNRTKFCTIFRSVCTEHHCLCWVTYIKGNCFDLFSIWNLLCASLLRAHMSTRIHLHMHVCVCVRSLRSNATILASVCFIKRVFKNNSISAFSSNFHTYTTVYTQLSRYQIQNTENQLKWYYVSVRRFWRDQIVGVVLFASKYAPGSFSNLIFWIYFLRLCVCHIDCRAVNKYAEWKKNCCVQLQLLSKIYA